MHTKNIRIKYKNSKYCFTKASEIYQKIPVASVRDPLKALIVSWAFLSSNSKTEIKIWNNLFTCTNQLKHDYLSGNFKEKVTPKNISFLSPLIKKNLHYCKSSHTLKFQPLKCGFFLWYSSPKKTKIQTLLLPFWIVLSSQASVLSCNSVWEMASKEAFNYHSGLWLLLS